MVTFIHTADWQLGKPFGFIEGDAAAVLREQRYETVRRIGEEATRRKAAAVLVAGDVFDSVTAPPPVIRRALDAMMSFTGPWVLLPGNHDPYRVESPWTRLQTIGIPENVIPVLEPSPVLIADDAIAVLPAPLTRRHEAEDVTKWMDVAETPAGVFRVGLAHGSMANRLPQADGDAANQISDSRARTANLDYLALGDWHGTVEIAESAWYSGTPEPDRFPRNDPGNILAVTLEAGTPAVVERVPIGKYDWRSVDVPVLAGGDAAPETFVDDALSEAAPEAGTVVLRIRLSGAVSLAQRAAVEDTLDRWQARLRYLDRDLSGLIDEPSDDDLDRIDHGGFVRAAVDRLNAVADDPSSAESRHARAALRILYSEHLAGGG